jgi:hypothetical protein
VTPGCTLDKAQPPGSLCAEWPQAWGLPCSSWGLLLASALILLVFGYDGGPWPQWLQRTEGCASVLLPQGFVSSRSCGPEVTGEST